MKQPLSLGDVRFFNFEIPEDLPNLFGVQKYAVHDFPSQGQGTRTIQALGSFPFPYIEWTGMFFDDDDSDIGPGQGGSSAFERASLLNVYKVQAQQIQLLWGPFNYQVCVAEFEIIGKLPQWLNYRIKVIPIVDQTSTSNTPTQQISPEQAVLDANTGVQTASSNTLGLLLPLTVQAAAMAINGNVSAALIAAGGSVSSLTLGTLTGLQNQIAALQLTLSPLIQSTNFGMSAAAINLSASLYALNSTLNINQNQPVTTTTLTNPNLYQLASMYYGDTNLWPLIAQANNLQSPMPIGTFTIIIPPQSTQSSLVP